MNALQELNFNQQTPERPWLPDNAEDYRQWTQPDRSGTFVVASQRFVFLQLSENSGSFHYWISEFPEVDAPEVQPTSAAELRTWLLDYMRVRDRRNITTYQGNIDTGFFYGVRHCKPCIICGRDLETVNNYDEAVLDQPSGGTNFTSHGHYGSTVFDPMSREHLSVNFCDECLTAKAKQGFVTHVKERKHIVDESIRNDFSPSSWQDDDTAA